MGKKVIISIASRDYLDSVGGAEKAIAVQQKQFNISNYEYVYIFPIKKKMGIISISMWGCRINGIYVGAFSEYSLLSHLKQSYSQNICAIMIHHLRFVDLEGVEMLLKAIERAPIYVYLHDYYLICNQYNLLKNGIKYCGGIGEDCNTCEFKDHTIQNKIRNVFNKFLDRLTFIAPSEIAKQIFAKNYPQYSRHTRVILHQTLKGMYKKNKQVIENRKIKIAFCGAPAANKGWDDWVELLSAYENNSSYEFYHLGVPALNEPSNSKHIDVRFKGNNLNPMINALRDNEIDVVFLWSNWPETYSYVFYECWASNVFILTQENSGNMAHMTSVLKNGIVLSNLIEVRKLLDNPELFKTEINNYKSTAKYGPELLYDNNDIVDICNEIKANYQIDVSAFAKRKRNFILEKSVSYAYLLKLRLKNENQNRKCK